MVTMVVEDGTVVDDANSYVSLAEANAYLEIKPNSTAWADLDDEVKEGYLMWATRLLDQRCFYPGNKYDETSALRWPRVYVTDRDGLVIDNDEIPLQLKQAVIEVAYHLYSQSVDPSVPASNPGGDSGIKKIVAAEVSIEYDTSGRNSANSNLFPNGINMLLTPIASLSGSGQGFGRIVRV